MNLLELNMGSKKLNQKLKGRLEHKILRLQHRRGLETIKINRD